MKKFFSICIVLILFFITSVVYATTTFIVKLDSNKAIIKSGEEVEVVIRLDNFTENENGINVFLATLDYDRNIFEEVQEDDITVLEFWTEPVFNKENGKFIVDTNSFVNTPHDALKIKLKSKENIENDVTTEIKIKDISASDGQIDILPEDAITVVQVEGMDTNDNVNAKFSDSKFIIMIIGILALIIIGSICIVFIKKKM